MAHGMKECYGWSEVLETLTFALVDVVRSASGQWTAHFHIKGTIKLDDGRVIPIDRQVAIGALVQRGRKPRKDNVTL